MIDFALRRILVPGGETLPALLHRDWGCVEKYPDTLRMPQTVGRALLIREAIPRGMSIQELAELAPNVKREMVALPFQSERQNELALLGLVRLSASILRKRARVCAVEATFESLREFLLLSLLLNERDLLLEFCD